MGFCGISSFNVPVGIVDLGRLLSEINKIKIVMHLILPPEIDLFYQSN